MQTKAILRKAIREVLQSMTAAQRNRRSQEACALLERQSAWKNAHSIFFYAPLPEELDVWLLVHDSLKAGKTVCLPRFNPGSHGYLACQVRDVATDIAVGKFGVREPASSCPVVPLNLLDLVLVPGVAFDVVGHRLGRGKGFYDRLLAEVSEIKCGVAFDEQVVTEIPIEPHDVRVNCIVTPTRWIEPLPAPVLE